MTTWRDLDYAVQYALKISGAINIMSSGCDDDDPWKSIQNQANIMHYIVTLMHADAEKCKISMVGNEYIKNSVTDVLNLDYCKSVIYILRVLYHSLVNVAESFGDKDNRAWMNYDSSMLHINALHGLLVGCVKVD